MKDYIVTQISYINSRVGTRSGGTLANFAASAIEAVMGRIIGR